MNHEKIDQICKEKSEKLNNGEIVLSLFVLIVIAILMCCQPAKENIKTQPVYEHGVQR